MNSLDPLRWLSPVQITALASVWEDSTPGRYVQNPLQRHQGEIRSQEDDVQRTTRDLIPHFMQRGNEAVMACCVVSVSG